MDVTSNEASLIICPAGGTLDGGVVGVNPATSATPTVAVLVSKPDDVLSRQSRAVRVQPLGEVPPGAVAIGRQTADELELREHGTAWSLSSSVARILHATELELEVTVDRSVETVSKELGQSTELAGKLLHLSKGQAVDSLSLELGGEHYRVRHLSPAPDGTTASVYQFGPATTVTLFSSGMRTPVDIVVLADISGSMNADDVKESEEVVAVERSSFLGLRKRTEMVTRVKRMTRIAAVKRALHNLLLIRRASPGRVSRIAVVAFDHECRVCFPQAGGMAELDESSPDEVVEEYRNAVALLRPDRGTTNIGRALHFAGKLLAQHSAPGNDRLIVLISDGADWHRQGDDATGEMVYGVQEPVSLMEELSTLMGVRLHALGVSTNEIFEPWWREKYPGQAPDRAVVPNHELLEELIKVGGGDPSRIGNTDVLLEYFEGLGKGVTRSIANLKPWPVPHLRAEERTHLLQVTQTWRQRQEEQRRLSQLSSLSNTIVESFWASVNTSAELAGRRLFDLTETGSRVISGALMEVPINSRNEFEGWWPKIQQLFYEARDPNTTPDEKGKKKTYCVPKVRALLLDDRARDLNLLRHWASHDFAVRGSDSNEKVSRVLMRLINQSYLKDSDQPGWASLQLRVLEELRDMMHDVETALAEAHAAKARGELIEVDAKSAKKAPAKPRFVFLQAPPL